MNIWMLSYLAPPQLNAESILVAKTVRHLVNQTQQVTLITSKLDPDFKVDQQLATYMGENVDVERFSNGYPSWKVSRRMLQRTLQSVAGDPQSIWTKAVCQWGDVQLKKSAASRPDILYSRSQPGSSHIAALHMKRLFNVPWVAQFNDPWAHNPYHPSKHGEKDKRVYLERQVMEQVDHVIFPTLEMAKLHIALYPQLEQKVSVLPHHYDRELYVSKCAGADSRIRMAYLGDFYGVRSPEPILKGIELAEALNSEMANKLEIVFIGNAEQRYQELIKAYQGKLQTTISRKQQVAYFESLQLMSSMGMLVMIDAPSDENIFLSSKLIDYLGSERPILGITSEKGTAAAILRRYKYPVVDPRETEGIAKALLDMVQNAASYQKQALTQYTDEYSSPAVTAKLIDIFEQLRKR